MISSRRRTVTRRITLAIFSAALAAPSIAGVAHAADRDSSSWLDFKPPADAFAEDSPIDLRGLNEKFAGAHGYIQAKGAQFVPSETGEPVRFWAVNVDLPKDEATLELEASTLAKYGVNMVRLMPGVFDKAGNLQPQNIQKTIALVEAMKAQGIYTEISLYFCLGLTPKPNTPWLEGYDGKTHPFAALFFNKDFQKQYDAWAKALLLTPSEKTGKRLIEDPALFGIELCNEDSYFFWTFNDKIPDAELRILETQFADWLKEKYGSLDKALAAWKNVHTPRDNVAQNRMGMRPLYNMFSEHTTRDQDTATFLQESLSAFYKNTATYLRGLGYKGMITDSNWTTANPRILGPLEKLTYTGGDYVDRHGYFDCLSKGPDAAWSVKTGETFADRDALRFEPETPGKPKDFVNAVQDPSYNDKPSMISETAFNRPNRYRSEAPLYNACYGALQDSDALVFFTFDSPKWVVKPGYFMQPWTTMSPGMIGQFPAAALIYRKGLVGVGDELVNLNLHISDVQHLKGSPLAQGASFDELRLKDVPKGTELTPTSVIDPLVHYAGRTNVNFTTDERPSVIKPTDAFIDRAHETVTSTTGQLVLDYGKGLLKINAPEAQGLSGNLKTAGETTLKDLAISSDLDLGNIIAVSLDGKPLATSGRILLQVMSEEKNSGFQTTPAGNDIQKIVNIGKDPWQIKALFGTVRFLRPDAHSLKVSALDDNGSSPKPAGNAAEIILAPGTLYYLITR